MKFFCFKFQQNRTINEEFDFGGGMGEGNVTPIHKFDSQLLFLNVWKCIVANFSKITSQTKNLIFGGGEGEGGGKLTPIHNLISIIIGKHVNMFCIKFQQNYTINEEYDFLKVIPLFINFYLNYYW